jgi:hypothetical protein
VPEGALYAACALHGPTAFREALCPTLQSPQSFAVCREGLLPDQFSLLIDLYATTLVAL